jgi:hypothetical protein
MPPSTTASTWWWLCCQTKIKCSIVWWSI